MATSDAQYNGPENRSQLDQAPPAGTGDTLPRPDTLVRDTLAQTAPKIRNIAMVAPLPLNTATTDKAKLLRPESQNSVRATRPAARRVTRRQRQTNPGIDPMSQQMAGWNQAYASPKMGIPGPHQGRPYLYSPQNHYMVGDARGRVHIHAPTMPALQRAPGEPDAQWTNLPPPAYPCVANGCFAPRGMDVSPRMNLPTVAQSQNQAGPMVEIRPYAGRPFHMGTTETDYMARWNAPPPPYPGGYDRGPNGPSLPQYPLQPRYPMMTAPMNQWGNTLTADMVRAARPSYVKTLMGGRMIGRGQMMSTDAAHMYAPQDPRWVPRDQNPITLSIAQDQARISLTQPALEAANNGESVPKELMTLSGHTTPATDAVDRSQPTASRALKRRQDTGAQTHSGRYPDTSDRSMIPNPSGGPVITKLSPTAPKIRAMENFERLPCVPNVELERTFGVPLPPQPVDITTWLTSCCEPQTPELPIKSENSPPSRSDESP